MVFFFFFFFFFFVLFFFFVQKGECRFGAKRQIGEKEEREEERGGERSITFLKK